MNQVARDLAEHFGKETLLKFADYCDRCQVANVDGTEAYAEFLLELTTLTAYLLNFVAKPGDYKYVREAFISALRLCKEHENARQGNA